MSLPPPVIAPPSLGNALGAGSGFAWTLHEIAKRFGLYVDVVPALPEPAAQNQLAQTAKNLAKGSTSRWRRLLTALGKQIADTFMDLVGESVKDAILFPGATIMLADAIAYWVYSDLLIKSTYDPVLNIPTAESFVSALNYVLDTVAALLATDIISNRDVGSDIAESVIDSFTESVVGDAVRAYLDTVAGVEAVDDDEIRDIVGDGALGTPEELAYLGARSGLDTFSAVAELYTGLLQGDNPYWSRVSRELDDNFKRFERGASADIYLAGALIERLGSDVIDSVYWYLEAVDYILNRIKTLARDAAQAYALYMQGAADADMVDQIVQAGHLELAAYNAVLDTFDDPLFIDALVDGVVSEYDSLVGSIDWDKVYKAVEALLDDPGKRLAEYANTAKLTYEKLNSLRKVNVATV
jgi:hypothetical protein